MLINIERAHDSPTSPLPSFPSPFPPSSDVDPDDENEQWFKAACYRCLIYMGDAGAVDNS